MKVPLIDLRAQYREIGSEIDEAIKGVLESGQFVLGANTVALEEEVSAYLGVQYGVGVASGTDGLQLALRAFDVGPGDEVIVPSYTFFATVEAVIQVGAIPVFVDVDPQTFCLNVGDVEDLITSNTKAVIPVHLYGRTGDMASLLELARNHRFKVIEDNAQAFGSEYQEQKTASLGDVGCLSFFPSKNLGCYGDGGMVVTDDKEVADRVKLLRTHGWRKKYFPETVGYNSRLDELQAAVLRVKLEYIDKWNNDRRQLAGRYSTLLQGLDIQLPQDDPEVKHVYHLYVIQIKDRDRIQRSLKAAGVASAVYYPQPLHLAEPCHSLGFRRGDFPVAERASDETLAIPLYPGMSDEQINLVVTALKGAVEATKIS